MCARRTCSVCWSMRGGASTQHATAWRFPWMRALEAGAHYLRLALAQWQIGAAAAWKSSARSGVGARCTPRRARRSSCCPSISPWSSRSRFLPRCADSAFAAGAAAPARDLIALFAAWRRGGTAYACWRHLPAAWCRALPQPRLFLRSRTAACATRTSSPRPAERAAGGSRSWRCAARHGYSPRPRRHRRCYDSEFRCTRAPRWRPARCRCWCQSCTDTAAGCHARAPGLPCRGAGSQAVRLPAGQRWIVTTGVAALYAPSDRVVCRTTASWRRPRQASLAACCRRRLRRLTAAERRGGDWAQGGGGGPGSPGQRSKARSKTPS